MRKFLFGLLLLLIIIQFIRPSLNKGEAFTSEDITHSVQVPDSIMSLLQTGCYDCHSNHTNYPWYSKITPVNWWLKSHIDEGKKQLNFSAYAQYNFKRKNQLLEGIAETIEMRAMPLESYLWIHHEAKFTAAQKRAIIDWTKMARQKLQEDSRVRSNNEAIGNGHVTLSLSKGTMGMSP